ncbi:MAG: hypothetical protein H0Z33_07185 [Bacillaceae bacterium]|nr:hypothetical protein [Bacillaceae bacterium]
MHQPNQARERHLYQHIVTTFMAVIVIALSSVSPVYGDNAQSRHVTLVVVNGLSFQDLKQMATFPTSDWIHQGYLGGMNLRTAGNTNDVNNYVTLGAGNRAVGSTRVTAAYHAWETIPDEKITAADYYYQLTGNRLKPGEIMVPGIAYIHKNNQVLPYDVIPGLLGQTLKDYGKSSAVLGNSDLGQDPFRLASLITMDQNGITAKGDVSRDTLTSDLSRPYGVKTDYNKLMQKWLQLKQTTDLTVLEAGDLYRLDTRMDAMDPEYFQAQRRAVLEEISSFILQLQQAQSGQDRLLVISPMVNARAVEEKALLAPVVMLHPPSEGKQGGLLTSATTKRDGIIANLDVAPTILNWLQIPVPDQMVGQVIQPLQRHSARVFATENGILTLQSRFWGEWENIHHVYRTRPDILFYYITFQVILLLIAAFTWLKVKWRGAYTWVRIALLSLLVSPVLFLLEPLIPFIMSRDMTLIVLVGAALFVSFLLEKLANPVLFLAVALLGWMPVVLDVMAGAPLMKQSYLGYDPLIGARFYGIGNEYMGVVIGSSILFLSSWLERKGEKGMKITSSLFFVFLLIVFAAPFWGTNAGGALTAIVAFSVTYIKLFDISLNRSWWMTFLLVFIAGFLLLISINLIQGEAGKTHIGRAVEWALAGDLDKILHIVERKLDMNWRLVQVSSWSKVFVTSIFVLALFLMKPRGTLQTFNRSYPYMMRGMTGIVAAALVTLLINDSGIVAAATTIIYAVVPLLFMALKHKEASASDSYGTRSDFQEDVPSAEK